MNESTVTSCINIPVQIHSIEYYKNRRYPFPQYIHARAHTNTQTSFWLLYIYIILYYIRFVTMSEPDMSFIAKDNLCGQTLLRLVARGSSIMAELFRLSQNVPAAFCVSASGKAANADAARYAPILFDFRYLKTQEIFERQVNKSVNLQTIDEELSETL